MNTEIGKTGEVIVEGHVIGRLDGFTFAPDAAEAGSDAKALQATALKALAGEIDARAEKLAAAPDDQFVLASDGTIRWTGDAVAKLVAADDALHPRIRIISDERLSGAPRDAVQARLDLWLKAHIEKLLGPLFDLHKAEDITGIARGIAFQLIEALGVLERARISAEMKDLDQPSRASLRKYGVRFGAYHIYIPALLKPAARALASLLWAQKLDNVDMSALSGAQHLAGSGRTSFPVDKSLDRDAYRVLGYRQCGERAVRVDILERLADLIRPALSWREASPGQKPAGAFDGRGFVVTQAMTSLTGSAGEDFASILRALGYRMEKKPALPPQPAVVETPAVEQAPAGAEASAAGEATPAETAAADAAPVDAASTEVLSPIAASAEAEGVASAVADAGSDGAQAGEDVAAPPATLLPDAGSPPAGEIDQPAAVEARPEPEAVVEAPAPDAVQEPATAATTMEAAADAAPSDGGDAAAVEATAAGPEVAAVPDMVEVWRPGGRSEDRRPRHDRNRHHRPERSQPAAAPAAAAGEAGATGEAAKGERHRRGRRNEFRKPRTDAPAEGVTAAAPAAPAEGAPASGEAREHRGNRGRPPRERFEGKGREGDKPQGKPQDRPQGKFGGGGRDKASRDKGGRDGRDKGGFGGKGGRDSGPSHRQWATSAAPRERDRPADPNSPFAKLAALKEQLTAGRKD